MNTDLELINATLSGDKSAFGILAARHQTQVYRLTYRIISNPSDASDIVQETLLRAYQNLERLRDKSKFSFWLLQIAKNQCIDWIREHQKALMTVEDELASNRLRLPPAPDEILVERELYERVMAEISKLPEHSQKAVEMFYIEGKSYTEIQRELGVTKGTLGRRLHNAKAQLRKRLRDAYLGAALWTGDSLKRLIPGHTRAITGSSAISGLKYLMVSAALHSLIFTGMSATGVHWCVPNGINDTSGYSSAIDISLIKVNSPDRISLPSYVFVELPSPVRADLKLLRLVEFMPAERIILKLPPPGPERLNSRIVRAEIPPGVPAQYLEAALIEPMIHNTSPLLDRATPGLNFAFPGATDALGRTSPIPDGRPLFRSRNELAFPDEAAKPVTGPLYDDKIQPRIVFISNREDKHRSNIYTMNIDGTGVKRLDDGDPMIHQWSASVSPKERKIAFHTSSNSRVSGPGIYSMGMDSGHLEFLAFGVSPAWSPDGKKITFCRPEAGNSEIYIIDGSSSEMPLTRSQASSFRPAWSPDSARIAFSSNIVDRRIRNLYVMNADGTDMKQLTHTSTVGRWNDYPAWSPDGTKIAYAAGKTGREYSIQSTIFIMDVDGSNRRALVAQAYCPTWSPDGRKIVFCSNRDGNEEIYVIDTDGKNLQRLTDNHYQDNQPSWISAGLLD